LSPGETPEAELLLYLGRTIDGADTPYVAAVLTDEAAATLGSGAVWGNLRELGSKLSDFDAGLFTEALALANWHAAHRFSPRTGRATSPALGGWVRRADGDDGDDFPRTDAAIIVGVTDAEDRILLGSNALWAENRYSLLAGFVEPGESLENAVVREVYEEAGIRVRNPVYLGSQPWPFPASIMLGFRATLDRDHPQTLRPDGEEILDLRWFSREELSSSLGEIVLPGGTSIARAILEDWFGGPIEDRHEW
jgi:NAD+ diphosphatase